MAYHKYQTEAFVLGSKEYGDASRVFFLFTDKFGAVAATASGVRKESSKLRYALQTYRQPRVELVRGKEMWRIVGAANGEQYQGILKNPQKRALYARMVKLINQFVVGEGVHAGIFYELQQALNFLAEYILEGRDAVYIEELWNLRLFKELGYIRDRDIFADVLMSPVWDQETIRSIGPKEKEVVAEINSALSAAQM